MKIIPIILSIIYVFLGHSIVLASPRYVKLSDRLVSDYTKKLGKEKGLCLRGSGGSMMDDIKKISLDYLSLEQLHVDGARQLYVEVVEGLLQNVNENERIRPYLHNYPFQQENVKIMISFRNENGRRPEEGHVALMFITRGNIISYEAYDLEKDDFYTLHEETYQEALKIVRDSSCAEPTN